MADLDFAATMMAGQQLVPDYVQQNLERQLGTLKTQAAAAQLQQSQAQLAQDQDYAQSMSTLTQNGHAATANDFAQVALRHPQHATAVKDAFNLLETGQQQQQLGTLAQMWAALGKGRNDLAILDPDFAAMLLKRPTAKHLLDVQQRFTGRKGAAIAGQASAGSSDRYRTGTR